MVPDATFNGQNFELRKLVPNLVMRKVMNENVILKLIKKYKKPN